jgi:FtsP/CotA-like multicopper oxidase with cupredoxin domain
LHGSTDRQVSGGALGVVIIEDRRIDNTYSDIPLSATNNNPNLATFLSTEKLLFFSETVGQSGFTERRVNGMGPLTSVTIPQISLVANQWYRFRIAVSKPSGANSAFTFSVPGLCSVRQLARDGIFLSSVPAPQSDTNSIAGPSRIDLAVRCPQPPTGTSLYINWDTTNSRVQLIINPGTPNNGFPYRSDGLSTWQPVRPAYLQDMRNVAVQQSLQITAGRDTMAWNSNSPVRFNPSTPLGTLSFNGVYEARIVSANAHPVHLHVYPMQIIGVWNTATSTITAGNCGTYKVGEFYDTIMSPQTCVVRFRAIDFGGKVVVHCHRLRHEDDGAMAWINVTGDPNAILQTPQVTAVPCTSFS